MSRVFISYSHKDQHFVRSLVRDLEARGLEVFFDRKIAVGEKWSDSLTQAIESADFILVVLSPDYLASNWAREELMIGLHREVEEQATVIPLMLRPCELPIFLAGKTYADFSQDYEAGLARVLPTLLQTSPADIQSSDPGGIEEERTPSEIAKLREELREAVAMFKADPPEPSEDIAAPERTRRPKCFIVMPF